jgi:sugar lactone lactonase YvrE
VSTPELLLDGIMFGEGPRWHAGRLWFSDVFARKVMTVDEQGNADTVCELSDGKPSGLGFLPDGRLLIVNMDQGTILRVDGPGRLAVHADLSSVMVVMLNDMVVDKQGRAYVGSTGRNYFGGGEPIVKPANIILVRPDGTWQVVASDVDSPNGPTVTPDGRTYVVTEPHARRLIAFDIQDDGTLTNRRIWADLSPAMADGIAVDSEGAIWCASPATGDCIRVREGGEVTDRVPNQGVIACALGGSDGRTLFMCRSIEANFVTLTGRGAIDVTRVQVSGIAS